MDILSMARNFREGGRRQASLLVTAKGRAQHLPFLEELNLGTRLLSFPLRLAIYQPCAAGQK